MHTTTPGSLGSLVTERGVSICCRYGFDSASLDTSHSALRCLCNVLFLAESTRQVFVETGHAEKAVLRMKVCLANLS